MKLFLSVVVFLWTASAKAQIEKNSFNAIGASFGFKNSFGAAGLFYSRSVDIKNKLIELKAGVGLRYGGVLGVGASTRIYNNNKNFETLLSADYSYSFPGVISYDSEEKSIAEEYRVTQSQYSYVYLTNRFFIGKSFSGKSNAALQLKTGYTFLLNNVNITTTYGRNEQYDRALRSVNSGLLIGLDLILYLRFSDLRSSSEKSTDK